MNPLQQIHLVKKQQLILYNPKFNKRPDPMAFELFGNARLWWVFAHYNRDKLKDQLWILPEQKSLLLIIFK